MNALKIVMPAPFPSHAPDCLVRYYTPPEVLHGIRDPAGDIWMFGIVALYAATSNRPFKECQTPMEFIQKLISGGLPDGIDGVTDGELGDLIRQCLSPHDQRPSAAQLVRHPFIVSGNALPAAPH
jgi:WNK lysine deficient protein kinase